MKKLNHIFIILPSLIFSQWLTFDLSKADPQNFKSQVTPTIIASTLSQNSFGHALTTLNRLGVSITIPVGNDLSGSSFQKNPLISPVIASLSFLITNNLGLTGKMNVLGNGEETIQSAGYGGLYISNTWTTDLSINWMEGPRYIRIRTINGSITKDKKVKSLNVVYGIGHSNYTGLILDLDAAYTIKSSISYLICGFSKNINGINISAQSNLHPSFIQLNLVLGAVFH